jgi:aconitate hydratase
VLDAGGARYRIARLRSLGPAVRRLPYSLRVLLENAARDGREEDVESILGSSRREILFRPHRVLLQDFAGIPVLVDLAALREAVAESGGDAASVNPRLQADLVIDHSIQVDTFGTPDALRRNAELELERNEERYRFLDWAGRTFSRLRVVPPGVGICHQVNLERLASVVTEDSGWALPDSVVGTDSHTTMVNALGVLGWGVGGIEAEAVMLGEPLSMLVPDVVGVRLHGALPGGATATDLVLTVTERLRTLGVVGKFVEFFGDGAATLSVPDRATVANMAPDYGATCGFFPVDDVTVAYLRLTGRSVELVEAYCRENLLWRDPSEEPAYSEVLDVDLGEVEASVAGPRRPQDRVALGRMPQSFAETLRAAGRTGRRDPGRLSDGSVVLAAITSCTNTSNPQLMVAAGLLARNAVDRGLRSKPWVKTSLAPGSQVVTDYLAEAGLLPALETLGFHIVGYGCTTCIGNSGPLPPDVAAAVAAEDLFTCAVLSGNRNFEGRIHPDVKASYLASPPLVVAYALAGRVDVDFAREPLAGDVFLADIWPGAADVDRVASASLSSAAFERRYRDVESGGKSAGGDALYPWESSSTMIRRPSYPAVPLTQPISGARCLVLLGDSVTTDHISPAGPIAPDSDAGRYLQDAGVPRSKLGSFGARRGNHETVARGAFGNRRLRNLLVPGREGPWTVHVPSGQVDSIHAVAERYRAEGTPTIVIAGSDYGMGSSRDGAAKGPALLGVRAVVARSFERIHRSNLLMMGIVPLQFRDGESAETLGLTGRESFSIEGVSAERVTVRADGVSFEAVVRLDTAREREYLASGGILPFVLRRLVEA